MLPRIFLSHSTEGTPDEPILRRLTEILREARFEVFVDVDSLQGGDVWREKLIRKLGACEGAVVLVNDRALSPEKKWVGTEANILRWRRWNEPNFILIIVRIGAVTTELIGKTWPALDFAGLQMLPKASGVLTADQLDAADSVFEEIVRVLNPLHEQRRERTSLERIRDAIADSLREALTASRPADLAVVARDLKIPEVEIDQAQDLCSLLADHLLIQGLNPPWFKAVIDKLSYALSAADGLSRLESIVYLAAPEWVHPAAVTRIAEVQHCPPPRPRFRINAELPAFTGPHYIQRACCRAPDFCWPYIEVQPKVGTQVVASVLDQIRAGLQSRFRGLSAASDAVIKRRLAQAGQPVFVILPPELADDAMVIAAIRNSFEELILLCLSSDAAPSDSADAVIDLEPMLQPGAEARACDNYWATLDLIPVSDS